MASSGSTSQDQLFAVPEHGDGFVPALQDDAPQQWGRRTARGGGGALPGRRAPQRGAM